MINIDKQEAFSITSLAGQPSLYQRISESFQGGSRWLVVASFLYLVLFIVIATLAVNQFFQAEATRDLILYATVFLACLIVIAMLKLWYWMELNKNALRRDIRRLEQQLVQTLQQRTTEA